MARERRRRIREWDLCWNGLDSKDDMADSKYHTCRDGKAYQFHWIAFHDTFFTNSV
jgi:hypothetical protein